MTGTLDEYWRWREGERGPQSVVIFDIDGVLADAQGRQHYLEWGDWRGFFEACGEDPVIEEIERLLELLHPDVLIALVTGRPHRVQEHTLGWLERYAIRWDLLIMRDRGDYSKVDEFKRGVLRELIDRGFDVRLALDDDPKNHAMYASEGVPCIYIHSGYYH